LRLRLPFALFLGYSALTSSTLAQSPKVEASVQRFIDAEQALNAEAQKRILAVRSAKTIWCGHRDPEGVLWFGTNEGLYRYEGERFTHFTTDDGLACNQIYSILDDLRGGIWLGTDFGLCRFDGKAFEHVPLPWGKVSGTWFEGMYPILSPNRVTSLVHDRNGHLWIGTCGAGAYQYDGKEFTQHLLARGQKVEDGPHQNWITSIARDQSDHLWFTSMSRSGASRFDGESFQHFTAKDGLSFESLRYVYQDRAGTIWFGNNGNRGGGLDSFDGESFSHHNEEVGHSHPRAHSIFQDRNGLLWFACVMDGICTYDGKTFTSFSSQQGAEFKNISFFLEDAAGKLWFGGGNHQLFRFDGKEVTQVQLKAAS
jgi:ligand-binding sensor domain-containing protein